MERDPDLTGMPENTPKLAAQVVEGVDNGYYRSEHFRPLNELSFRDRMRHSMLVQVSEQFIGDTEPAQSEVSPDGQLVISRTGTAAEDWVGEGSVKLTQYVSDTESGDNQAVYCLEFEAEEKSPGSTFKLVYSAQGGLREHEVSGVVPLLKNANPFERALDYLDQAAANDHG